jgi:hypothetical protein
MGVGLTMNRFTIQSKPIVELTLWQQAWLNHDDMQAYCLREISQFMLEGEKRCKP